ncbi:MAG: hypothetical protein WAV93_08520 [Bacteroidales bacterium]
MKITMKISGIAGTVLLGFAALVRIMHWPGASDEWTRQMFQSNARVWSLIYLDGLETNLKLLRANIR